MAQEYVHLPLGEDIIALAGYYTPQQELRLPSNGKEVLCVIGMCCVESGCCGNHSGNYAIVPGYIISWKSKQNKDGCAVSEIESITDATARQEITRLIRESQPVWTIDFW